MKYVSRYEGDSSYHRETVRSHLYQRSFVPKKKSVPFVPKLFNSISDWSNCEPTNYCSDFRYKSNGLIVLGAGFFSSDRF